ncbi:hypothetical protein GBF35_25690 [Nonomuraea phyllanthi]|uniref:hypothetical protein n=1 Tax=Nonomuraea phyllanthi TaxID=2219224 RepID=UPI001292DC28|nr:hypothetical protein [Nonomuraea phyllanthi]QFY09593.1 hypothetical protein GBF35_25690 [Nonomuraea phyllanthi]
MSQPSPHDASLPADAALIQRLRTNRGLDGPLTVAKCTEMLGTFTARPFSDRSWSAYEQGKRAIPDREYVLMALVVGATPEDVQAAGRDEAAKLLSQELDRRRTPELSGASARTVERVEAAIARIRELPFSEETQTQMIEVLLRQVDALLDLHDKQMDIMRHQAP